MRHLLTIATLILLFSCVEKNVKTDKTKVWTEEQKRNYFTNIFSGLNENTDYVPGDSTRTFEYFFKTQYPDIKAKYKFDQFPYAIEEEYVDTTKLDSNRHWFRIIVDPCFRRPYCFTIEKKFGKSFLITKITNGFGCYYTGVLNSTIKFTYGDSLYNNIAKQLLSLNFWNLGRDTTCLGGTDGEEWTIEAIENGKYNVISRWLPQDCGDSATRQLGQIGQKLGKLSRLDKILSALGAPKSDL